MHLFVVIFLWKIVLFFFFVKYKLCLNVFDSISVLLADRIFRPVVASVPILLPNTAFTAVSILSDRWLSGRLAIRWRRARLENAPSLRRSWLTSSAWASRKSPSGPTTESGGRSDNNAEPWHSSWPMIMTTIMMIRMMMMMTYFPIWICLLLMFF